MTTQRSDRLLRIPEVLAIFPVSRTTWFDGVRRGKYPRQIKIGKRCVAWREADIHDLIQRLQSEASA
jgi:prophage regulatory protein